ncbi:tyrosine-type recombinase/integrase [Bacillus toyonensis]|uniref:tyrosine-type recombinase/integrase n=1 Tax=Bacillus toyonensis TaxID=155322 RepID=UPI00027C0036|nr:tyrosine-type recombinase/integrase [Bacillus toyonensis]EJV95961.1 hypothetical protein IGI_01054 [Bacillus toyonensis]
MNIIKLGINEEIIEALSESSFSLLTTIEESKSTLQQLKKLDLLISGEFDDDLWLLANPNSKGRTHKIDFNELHTHMFSTDLPNEFKLIVKCWISELLNKFKTTTVVNQYYHFLLAFKETHGFQKETVNQFIEWLHKPNIENNTKIYLITSMLNFFDYSDLEVGEIFIPKLHEVNSKLNFIHSVRQLPPSKEILKFSYYLEKHFETIKQLETKGALDITVQKEKILYYPLLIWWKLTNVIPIRSVEFAAIKRNCLSVKNNEYFIHLPRRKIHSNNKRNIQILDTVAISKDIYDLINNYINDTQSYGYSNTLVSYPSLIWTDSSNRRKRQKRVSTDFNRENLQRLITKFYKDVLSKTYNCDIPKEYHLSPNDTRHLAFVSLMMQGISPVEIARLGGHQTINAQYHYSSHIEYWIDSEVFKLFSKFKHLKGNQHKGQTSDTINDSFIPKEIQLKAFAPPTSSFQGKLKVGYCTDALQRCESEECMLCSHWRINTKELLEKEELIKEILLKKRKHIHELFAFIKNLHSNILKDELTRINSNTLGRLKTTSKQVQAEISNLTALQTLNSKGGLFDE